MLRRAPTRVEIKNDDLDELAVAARARQNQPSYGAKFESSVSVSDPMSRHCARGEEAGG
jgi:hypothetical protein